MPIALMGYLNPILAFGPERFADACARAGVDAVIVPDLLPEEADVLAPLAARGRAARLPARADLHPGPHRGGRPRRERLPLLRLGGGRDRRAKRAVAAEVGPIVAAVRARSPVPVVIGFGVSEPAQARALAPLADGVVVGSAIVARIAEPGARRVRAERVRAFVGSLARALRR